MGGVLPPLCLGVERRRCFLGSECVAWFFIVIRGAQYLRGYYGSNHWNGRNASEKGDWISAFAGITALLSHQRNGSFPSTLHHPEQPSRQFEQRSRALTIP
jgi:hypothetical protein